MGLPRARCKGLAAGPVLTPRSHAVQGGQAPQACHSYRARPHRQDNVSAESSAPFAPEQTRTYTGAPARRISAERINR